MSKKFTFALMALAMTSLTSVAADPINGDPILDVDDIPGVTKQYTKTVIALSSGNEVEDTKEHCEVHFGDNGMVYFLNFTGTEEDTYIMASKKSDTELTIPLPQLDYLKVGGMSDGGDITYILDLVKEVPLPQAAMDMYETMYGSLEFAQMMIEMLGIKWYDCAYDQETSVTMVINEDESMHLEFPEGLMIGLIQNPVSSSVQCPVGMPIVSITLTPEFETGIDMIDSEAVSVVYYDLQGRKVENPTEGSIYISVTTKADGSKVSKKVVK